MSDLKSIYSCILDALDENGDLPSTFSLPQESDEDGWFSMMWKNGSLPGPGGLDSESDAGIAAPAEGHPQEEPDRSDPALFMRRKAAALSLQSSQRFALIFSISSVYSSSVSSTRWGFIAKTSPNSNPPLYFGTRW